MRNLKCGFVGVLILLSSFSAFKTWFPFMKLTSWLTYKSWATFLKAILEQPSPTTLGTRLSAVLIPKPSSSRYLMDALSSRCINKMICIVRIGNANIPPCCSNGFNLFLLFLMIWTNYPQNNLTSFLAGTWLLSLWFCEFNAVIKNRRQAAGVWQPWFQNQGLSTQALSLGAGCLNGQHLPLQPARQPPLNWEDIHLPHISCTLIEQNSLPVGKPK